jgi:hypothetical protein
MPIDIIGDVHGPAFCESDVNRWIGIGIGKRR